MKKDLMVHFSFFALLFLLITLLRTLWRFDVAGFWVGGILGTLLPDIDHFIYAYVLKPLETTSAQIRSMVAAKKYKEVWEYVVATRRERTGLLFHTAFFIAIFLVFTFLITTSSGSLFGRGIVLAFSLHLLTDMLVDYKELKNIDNWFVDFPFQLTAERKVWFLWGSGALLLAFGFLL